MGRPSPLETPDVSMPQAGCCVAVGLDYRCVGVGTPVHLGLSVLSDCLDCMLQQLCAIGLQIDCMMAVPAPVVRLPDSNMYALWP